MVIDASVALKWFLDDEDGISQAFDLLAQFSENKIALSAPYLFPYEVSNGLVVAQRRGRLAKELILMAVHKIKQLGIGLEPVDQEEIVKWSFELGMSSYDAAYLAMALKRHTSLITADKAFYEKAHRFFPQMIWLGDWGSVRRY